VGGLDVRTESGQAVNDGGDPVRLLESQFLGAAHHGLPFGERAEQSHQRQLVNRQRNLLAGDLRAHQRGRGHVEIARRLVAGNLR
jgi:hypothetical protein